MTAPLQIGAPELSWPKTSRSEGSPARALAPAPSLDAENEGRPHEVSAFSSPLVAVCGLCGGAGASTLAYLVARSATFDSERPVLLADAGGPTGALAAYAGVEAPRSLISAANRLAASSTAPPEGLFADGGSGLRVMAGAPDIDLETDPAGIERLLQDAREAHALTVVDCGTLRSAGEREVLRAATHAIWVVPATVSGLRRGRRMIEFLAREQCRTELVVARRDTGGRTPPTEQLADLAAARSAPLVLMADAPDLGETDWDQVIQAARLTLDAIRTLIRW